MIICNYDTELSTSGSYLHMASLYNWINLLWLVIFELDVEAVFDANLHFDRVVHFWIVRQSMDNDVLFFH